MKKGQQLYAFRVIRNDGKVYNSISEASKDIDSTPGAIYNVLKGKNKTVKGFDFRCIDNQDMNILKDKTRKERELAYESQKRPIIDSNGVEYISLFDASRKLNLKVGNISKVLKGLRNHVG